MPLKSLPNLMQSPMEPSAAPAPPARAGRLLSLDAYRGFAMFLMAA